MNRPKPEQFDTTENAFRVYKTIRNVVNIGCWLALIALGASHGASTGLGGAIAWALVGLGFGWVALVPVQFLLQIPFWQENKYEDALDKYESDLLLSKRPLSKSTGTGHPLDAYGDLGDSDGGE